MDLIQFDGRTVAVVAPEDLEELEATAVRLRAENERLRALLIRYRTETPLGHQPYMIADEVDAALAAGGE